MFFLIKSWLSPPVEASPSTLPTYLVQPRYGRFRPRLHDVMRQPECPETYAVVSPNPRIKYVEKWLDDNSEFFPRPGYDVPQDIEETEHFKVDDGPYLPKLTTAFNVKPNRRRFSERQKKNTSTYYYF
ncbi:hypothetical protein ACJJTC_010596 [Scirpophaga incertulas]